MGTSMEMGIRWVAAYVWWIWGRSRVIANEYRASFWDDENVLKLIVLVVAQLCKCTKDPTGHTSPSWPRRGLLAAPPAKVLTALTKSHHKWGTPWEP